MTHFVLLDLQFTILRVVLLKLVPVACYDDDLGIPTTDGTTHRQPAKNYRKRQPAYATHCSSSKHKLGHLIASAHELNLLSAASAYFVILSNFITYELIGVEVKSFMKFKFQDFARTHEQISLNVNLPKIPYPQTECKPGAAIISNMITVCIFAPIIWS
uniref:Uncharacterized protein n=1 Tax=Glossina austeni TaxID=7395 RepID=A0A1A9UPD6_GLOAU